MANEDFTTYTEVDPNNHITVTTSKIDFVTLNRNESAYVYKDMGVNHFDGDWEHLGEFKFTSGTLSPTVFLNNFCNAINDVKSIQDASGDVQGLYMPGNTANPKPWLVEIDGGIFNTGIQKTLNYVRLIGINLSEMNPLELMALNIFIIIPIVIGLC